MNIRKKQKCGRWLVISKAGRNKWGGLEWNCICDCGTAKKVRDAFLKSGRSKSCGCLYRELAAERKTTHGMSRTPEYQVWHDMIQRCTNLNNKQYKHYGRREIKVCLRWYNFESFFADMGERPSSKFTIERIDNDKGYGPNNCKWGTRMEQSRNTRIQKNNTTGNPGVCWHKTAKKYHVRITVNNKGVYLGLFANLSDAVAARKAGEAKYWNKEG